MRAVGEQARLYYDSQTPVEEGDFIQTPTGRTYLVTFVRVQTEGKHAGRQHLVTVVWDPENPIPTDAVVHPIHWYSR